MQCWPRQWRCPKVFYKKNVFLEISQNSLKTPVPESLFLQRPATLLKKRLWHRCFPVSFAIFLRTNTFFTEHIWATASSQIDPDKIVNYFSVKSCLKAVDQHQTHWFTLVSFLCNFGSGRSKQRCIWLFSCEKLTIRRSSRSQMFFKRGVFKNFAIFTGKHLSWKLSLIKLLG